MRNITAIVVFCSTPDLVEPCLNSFRKFYPNMRLIIIDNSAMTSSKIFKDGSSGKMCTEALKKYCENDDKAELHIMPYNMGHGLALHYGIIEVKTRFTYIFESDVEHLKSNLIENMLKRISKNTYGVGPVVNCTYKRGHLCNVDYHKQPMKMLWPYSSIIVTKKYFEFPPFDSDDGVNASPILKSSQAIHNSGNVDKLYVSFNVNDYILHGGGGTRKVIGIPRVKWNL